MHINILLYLQESVCQDSSTCLLPSLGCSTLAHQMPIFPVTFEILQQLGTDSNIQIHLAGILDRRTHCSNPHASLYTSGYPEMSSLLWHVFHPCNSICLPLSHLEMGHECCNWWESADKRVEISCKEMGVGDKRPTKISLFCMMVFHGFGLLYTVAPVFVII